MRPPLPASAPAPRRGLLAVLAGLLLAGCSTWRPAAVHEGWTLYEVSGEALAVEAYEAAFAPAFEAVEARLGAFEGRVDVHAWHGSVRVGEGGRTRVLDSKDTGVHDVPGIGPARIQAYHSRRGGGLFARSGVFIGVPDPGTAVHELAHARFAELSTALPLWLEEGIATLLGDGALVDGRWVVDGLACWPLRELAEERFDDDELRRLLAITASEDTPVRDNVLVHFVGWAVAFDHYRQSGELDWRRWNADLVEGDPLPVVRASLARTLAPQTALEWLERLSHPDPGVRFATAKGVWKLRSRAVLDRLLQALDEEPVPEVRVALAINAMAAAGELRLSWRRWREVETAVRGALRRAELDDPDEQRALDELRWAARTGDESGRAHGALRALARFWEE